jgi:hypothetical protein
MFAFDGPSCAIVRVTFWAQYARVSATWLSGGWNQRSRECNYNGLQL